MKNNKSVKKQLLIIIGLFLLIGGISYALFNFVLTGQRENIISSAKISFLYEETNTLTVTNTNFLTDEEGIVSGQDFKFNVSVNNAGSKPVYYLIYLTLDNTNTMNNSYVRFYLNDKTNNKVLGPISMNELEKNTNYINSYNLYEQGFNSSSGNHEYTLTVWLSGSGELQNIENNNSQSAVIPGGIFKFKVNVEASPEGNVNLNLDTSGANMPDLATGMIPVYYDSTNDTWRKADSENKQSQYRWYSYTKNNNDTTKGMWANAVTYDRTKVHDESEKNQDGTITGATYTNDGMKFDGTDDIVKAVGTKNYNFGSSITFAARFKLSNEEQNETYSKIVDQLYDNMGFAFTYVKSSKNLCIDLFTNRTSYNYLCSDPIEKDTWISALGTYDGNILKLYINGILVGSKEVTGSIDVHTLGEISVGGQDYTNLWHFKGIISDALVINDALDATTIANNYGTNFNYKTNSNTVFYYNMRDYVSRNNGIAIPMSMINTMFVWIPRFSAVTPSNYNGGTAAAPGAIDVTFVNITKPALDAFWWDENSDGIQDAGEQKSGFWFGKFETSHSTLASSTTENNLGCTNETCSNANGIIIKPNVTSLRYNNVSDFFFAGRSMGQANNSFGFVSSEVDTHMLKNNEWGAAAYLTQSISGRCTSNTSCTEVTINNNSSYYTGGNNYKTNINQSTTGTIYGIYDMSGGAWEYVMGNYNNYSGYNAEYNSGFNGLHVQGGSLTTGVAFPASKYYNLYTSSSYNGHALTETDSWYGDYNDFFAVYGPWFGRGGYKDNGSIAGLFSFGGDTGRANTYISSRVTIIK